MRDNLTDLTPLTLETYDYWVCNICGQINRGVVKCGLCGCPTNINIETHRAKRDFRLGQVLDKCR